MLSAVETILQDPIEENGEKDDETNTYDDKRRVLDNIPSVVRLTIFSKTQTN
jgi:hypothetical protein